jgi:hypothetical protein
MDRQQALRNAAGLSDVPSAPSLARNVGDDAGVMVANLT